MKELGSSLPEGVEYKVTLDTTEVARINALAKKAKTEGLTDAEKKEQQELRAEYVADFRKSLKAQLDNTVVINPDGSSYKLKQDKK